VGGGRSRRKHSRGEHFRATRGTPRPWLACFMHGKELRWLVVFKRKYQGLSAEVVHEHLLIPECTQRRWLSFLKKYNDVFPPRVKTRGRPAKLDASDVIKLLKRVVDSPTTTMARHRAELVLAGGRTVSISTLCRVLHENGLSRQRVRPALYGRAAARPLTVATHRHVCRCSTSLASVMRTRPATSGWSL
jgi:transposase